MILVSSNIKYDTSKFHDIFFPGVYVVPNPTNDHPNMFVGIILPRDLEPRLEEEFVFALQQFSVLKTSDIVEQMGPEQRQRTSRRIAEFLIKSGEYLAQNTQNIANKTGKYMADKGEQYRTNMVKVAG
jgi:hypothetical protein